LGTKGKGTRNEAVKKRYYFVKPRHRKKSRTISTRESGLKIVKGQTGIGT